MVSSVGERVWLADDDSESSGALPVNVIAAPTYDADGRQSLVLTLNVNGPLERDQIERRGADLVAVAAAITAEVGGVHTDD